MLTIEFWPDMTDPPDAPIGNYHYKVIIRQQIIAEGELRGHDRRMGWPSLLFDFADKVRRGEEDARLHGMRPFCV